jgi:hypothetical protein
MEALRSSETSVLTRAVGRNIPDDGILHNVFLLLTLQISLKWNLGVPCQILKSCHLQTVYSVTRFKVLTPCELSSSILVEYRPHIHMYELTNKIIFIN